MKESPSSEANSSLPIRQFSENFRNPNLKIALLTRARQLFLSWDRSIDPPSTFHRHTIPWKLIFVLSSYIVSVNLLH